MNLDVDESLQDIFAGRNLEQLRRRRGSHLKPRRKGLSPEEEREEHFREMYSVADVPRKYHGITKLEHVEALPKASVEGVRRFEEVYGKWIKRIEEYGLHEGENLLIYGGHDSGKTCCAVLAMVASTAYLEEGDYYRHFDPFFISSTEYIAKCRMRQQERILTLAAERSTCVIDDIGAEVGDTNYVIGELSALLDIRWGTSYPTIITTNVFPDSFNSRFGERIAARLTRSCVSVRV